MGAVTESATLKPGCNALYEPATEELKRLRSSLERATGCRILFVREFPDDVKQTENAIEAAALAAGIVFNDKNPEGAWVGGEDKSARDELIRLCGLAAWHPFKPTPCPLGSARLDQALAFLRFAFGQTGEAPGYADAAAFVKWAKDCATL